MARKISLIDIGLLLTLASFWGSAFLFVKIAVVEIPPMTLAAGRVALGAVTLMAVVIAQGKAFPRDRRSWIGATAVGVIGTVIPFYLIGWGQQRVDAALTAICMASVPLFTLPLAHVMTHDEKLAPVKIGGTVVGFAGVALLVLAGSSGAPNATPAGLTAILTAAFCYAAAGLLIRRISHNDAVTAGAMILVTGALVLMPLSTLIDRPWTLAPSAAALSSAAVLGVFATGLATLALVALVSRAGATFASLNNYLVPVVGMACGVIWLNESLSPPALFAFALIVIGVLLTSRKPERNGNRP